MIICRSSRLHQEGRIAIVTDVGSGQRWTPSVADERHARRTVKSCGPGPPTLGSSLAKTFGRATGANKPAPRGEREAAVKTIAQGVPAVRLPCGFLRAQSAHFSARKARGCGQHPVFPAPSSSIEGDE